MRLPKTAFSSCACIFYTRSQAAALLRNTFTGVVKLALAKLEGAELDHQLCLGDRIAALQTSGCQVHIDWTPCCKPSSSWDSTGGPDDDPTLAPAIRPR